MDLLVIHAARVGHYDVYVIAGITEIIIDKQSLCVSGNKISDGPDEFFAWTCVTPDSSNVGLDCADCDPHTETNS